MNGVRYFKNLFFVLAAFVWLPVSAHCQLEKVPGLEFLRCSADPQAACGNTENCNDCRCCAIERSSYKSEQSPLIVSLPDLLPVSTTPVPDLALPDEVSLGILTTAPPQLLKIWHFTARMALPVRAPSIAS